jgi:hypothetical protein
MGFKISKIPIIFRKKKIKNKNCKDLGVGQDLTEFEKILTPKSLKLYIYIYIYIYILKNTRVF